MDDLSTFATLLADTAGDIARQYFRTGVAIDTKSDDTPVTRADREIEAALRRLVAEHRPDDGIVGEEYGNQLSKNGYTWVFDPIDGTKSFTIGRPTFGTLIGLCKDDTPILGIIDQPILKERWLGVQGQPTTFNGTPVKTRPCATLKDAIIGTGSASQIGADACQRLEAAARYMVYHGDCYFYGLIANGWMDCAVEAKLGVYDYIALVPVIEGAGGKITDWQGQPLTLNSGETCAASGDPQVHQTLLNIIGKI